MPLIKLEEAREYVEELEKKADIYLQKPFFVNRIRLKMLREELDDLYTANFYQLNDKIDRLYKKIDSSLELK
jgi:hypothetical protein